jgi:uracil-DNA glycosylase
MHRDELSEAGLPAPWRRALAAELAAPYFAQLRAFVEEERRRHSVYPPAGQVLAALRRTPLPAVRVLLLGQDPYHGEGQAHGLCFSVPPGVAAPPSLRNVFRELQDDLGIAPPAHGDLGAWADRGVLLLNTVLTVRAGEAHSHRGAGWERFTDAVISALSARERPFVALLWGGPARAKKRLIDLARHRVVEGPHPSPLSAHAGFFGSRPFSAVGRALRELGEPPLDWRLPA